MMLSGKLTTNREVRHANVDLQFGGAHQCDVFRAFFSGRKGSAFRETDQILDRIARLAESASNYRQRRRERSAGLSAAEGLRWPEAIHRAPGPAKTARGRNGCF